MKPRRRSGRNPTGASERAAAPRGRRSRPQPWRRRPSGPKYDCLRLLSFQESLPFRLKLEVGPVVVGKLQLRLLGVGPFKDVDVHVPNVRGDELRTRMAVSVDHLDGLG